MHLLNGEKILQEGIRLTGKPIFLIFRKNGMYPAGSLARHWEDSWGVIWEFEGSRHGQWHATPDKAREHFDRVNKAYEYAQAQST